MSYQTEFLSALALTLAIEVPMLLIAARFLYGMAWSRTNLQKLVVAGLICSSLTLPYLWFVLPSFIQDRTAFLILGESLVTFAEGLILTALLPVNWKKAFVLSILCNMTSFFAGELRRFIL